MEPPGHADSRLGELLQVGRRASRGVPPLASPGHCPFVWQTQEGSGRPWELRGGAWNREATPWGGEGGEPVGSLLSAAQVLCQAWGTSVQVAGRQFRRCCWAPAMSTCGPGYSGC